MLRIIQMERFLGGNDIKFNLRLREGEDGRDTWLVLGHFDIMRLSSLDDENGNCFRLIENHQSGAFLRRNSSERNENDASPYLHPVYLVSSAVSSEGGKENVFWALEKAFIGVVRIHFLAITDVEESRKKLTEEILSKAAKEGGHLHIHCYQTAELSDIAIIIKSDRFDQIIDYALQIRSFDGVGKAYSYFGVNYSLLDGNVQLDSEDEIQSLTMRISVGMEQDVESRLQVILNTLGQTEVHAISGSDDLELNWKKLKTAKLVALYRQWFVEGQGVIGKCFLDVTSIAGIQREDGGTSYTPKPGGNSDREKLSRLCEGLCGRKRELILKWKKLERPDWMMPFSELVNAMAFMSRSAIFDEFIFLLYPGVSAFLDNCLSRAEEMVEHKLRQRCDSFVTELNTLLEHIVRNESQLTFFPELHPRQHEIPFVLLEHTLAFLNLCETILQSGDEEQNKRRISVMIIPQLTERIEAEEYFSATALLPGLVMIRLPYSYLSNTLDSQISLCHEVSHYIGERPRHRDGRVNQFAHSAAVLTASTCFESFDPVLIDYIRNELANWMNKESALTMDAMKIAVENWFTSTFESPVGYAGFIKGVARKPDQNTGRVKRLIISPNVSRMRERITKSLSVLNEVGTLYREIYADICMLCLLGEQNKEADKRRVYQQYIRILDNEVPTDYAYEDKNTSSLRIEVFAVRLFVCLRVGCAGLLFPHNELEQNMNSPALRDEVSRIALEYNDFFAVKDDPSQLEIKGFYERIIPLEIIDDLMTYANACRKTLLEEVLARNNDVTAFRKSFLNSTDISGPLDWSMLENTINKYRRELLNQMGNPETPRIIP